MDSINKANDLRNKGRSHRPCRTEIAEAPRTTQYLPIPGPNRRPASVTSERQQVRREHEAFDENGGQVRVVPYQDQQQEEPAEAAPTPVEGSTQCRHSLVKLRGPSPLSVVPCALQCCFIHGHTPASACWGTLPRYHQCSDDVSGGHGALCTAHAGASREGCAACPWRPATEQCSTRDTVAKPNRCACALALGRTDVRQRAM